MRQPARPTRSSGSQPRPPRSGRLLGPERRPHPPLQPRDGHFSARLADLSAVLAAHRLQRERLGLPSAEHRARRGLEATERRARNALLGAGGRIAARLRECTMRAELRDAVLCRRAGAAAAASTLSGTGGACGAAFECVTASITPQAAMRSGARARSSSDHQRMRVPRTLAVPRQELVASTRSRCDRHRGAHVPHELSENKSAAALQGGLRALEDVVLDDEPAPAAPARSVAHGGCEKTAIPTDRPTAIPNGTAAAATDIDIGASPRSPSPAAPSCASSARSPSQTGTQTGTTASSDTDGASCRSRRSRSLASSASTPRSSSSSSSSSFSSSSRSASRTSSDSNASWTPLAAATRTTT